MGLRKGFKGDPSGDLGVKTHVGRSGNALRKQRSASPGLERHPMGMMALDRCQIEWSNRIERTQ
jgi:hypothetical protein